MFGWDFEVDATFGMLKTEKILLEMEVASIHTQPTLFKFFYNIDTIQTALHCWNSGIYAYNYC